MTHRYFIIHKPYGYLSQFVSDPKKQKKKKVLAELYDFPEGTMAIGRLDEDSEGLLLLTTDGKISEYVRSSHIDKEYYAQVDGLITSEDIDKLQQSMELNFEGDWRRTKPCTARLLEQDPEFPERSRRVRDDRHGPTSWVSVTLTEGRFRQVRKMTAAVGFPTLRLVRVRIGAIYLNGMPSGAVQEVDTFPLTA